MTRNFFFAAATSLALLAPVSSAASAQDIGQYVGDIILVGFRNCPRDFMPAEGQMLEVQQYEHLFRLLSNSYGGDGRRSFALPNLSGRTPVHYGPGPGLNPVAFARRFGRERNQMTANSMGVHWHEVTASTSPPDTANPVGATFPSFETGPTRYVAGLRPVLAMKEGTVLRVGEVTPAPFNNVAPVLSLTYCIAVQGIAPPKT